MGRSVCRIAAWRVKPASFGPSLPCLPTQGWLYVHTHIHALCPLTGDECMSSVVRCISRSLDALMGASAVCHARHTTVPRPTNESGLSRSRTEHGAGDDVSGTDCRNRDRLLSLPSIRSGYQQHSVPSRISPAQRCASADRKREPGLNNTSGRLVFKIIPTLE